MKLTGKLKEKVSKAETKEQAKEMIASAGMELTDEEMNMVSAGSGTLMMQSNSIQDWVDPGSRRWIVQQEANAIIQKNEQEIFEKIQSIENAQRELTSL